MKDFIDLEVWKIGRELANQVYSLTKQFPKDEMFGLTSQIRRSAVSVPSNIAEGSGRFSKKESLQFFYIARGSLYELETQLYLALDQKYITESEFTETKQNIEKAKKMLNGLIAYFKKETSH